MTEVAERLAAVLAAHPAANAWASRLACVASPGEDVSWGRLGAPDAALAEAWLATEMECEGHRGMDAKAAAAYLAGRLGFTLGTWLVRLHYGGLAAQAAPWARPRLVPWEHEGTTGISPVFDLRIEPDALAPCEGSCPDALRALGQGLAALMRPLVRDVQACTRLPAAAQWRQFADGLTTAFLEHGKAQGCVERAMADARTAIAAPSPLWNRQVGFVELHRPAEGGCAATCEWVQARGGCCRHYTLKGGSYCPTCVHRDPESRCALLLACARAAG